MTDPNIKGQINWQQFKTTMLAGMVGGAVTFLGIVQADLPKLLDGQAPWLVSLMTMALMAAYQAARGIELDKPDDESDTR